MSSPSVPVAAVQPPAGYIGGKRNLARRLTTTIDAIPHRTYAEPCIGMGGIFFRRRQRPPVEVINDISRDVSTLFLILREHGPEFIAYLKRWWISSRDEFERLLAIDPAKARLTDFNRAARFLYLHRLAFGGKVDGRTFGVDARSSSGFDLAKLESVLEAIRRRLTSVTVECLPFGSFIDRYDKTETLFYIDPPYWGCEADYGPGVFSREDFARLADQLAGIDGKFLLSINDTPGVREVFGGFAMQEVETTYSLSTATPGGPKRAGELIITNLPAEAVALAA